MTTNDSAPNVPQPINPAEQIALTTLAKWFDERHADRHKLAEQFREDDEANYPEQAAIAHTLQNAANITWELAGGRPVETWPPRLSNEHRIRIGASELGKLIAMATAPQESPANECSNGERTQYELTIERQKEKIAELEGFSGGELNREFRNKTIALNEANAIMNDAGVPYSHLTVGRVQMLIEDRDQARTETSKLAARIAELAKVPVVDGAAALQQVQDTMLAVHEFVCNETMIRGVYHEDDGRTYTRDSIAFDATTLGIERIPTLLSLRSGDIVEIRVIERADR